MNDLAHHSALAEGHEVNWYQIQKVLGQGGFGITYLAYDRNLQTEVALKEYFPSAWAVRLPDHVVKPSNPAHVADFEWGLRSFLREGRILVRFDHPCLVRVMSVFEANQTAYLVMRFERGADLRAVLKHADELAESDIKEVLSPLLDGLSQMHIAGVIHRDIKPENIFIRADGRPLLLDFGAARQAMGARSQNLTAVGTAGYAPVEQYSDDAGRQGPWTDIYAIGATVYHAVAGRAPKDALARAHAILAGLPDPLKPLSDNPPIGFSPEFIKAIDHALAFRSEDRPQSVKAFARELGISLNPVNRSADGSDHDAETVVLPGSETSGPYARTVKLTDPVDVDTNQWEIGEIQDALTQQAHAPDTARQAPRPMNPVNAWRAAVGPSNQDYYVTRLALRQGRPGLSWNWGAFLFTSAWLMFRKMYLWALVVYPAIAVGSFAAAWWFAGAAFPGAPRDQIVVLAAWFLGLSTLAGIAGNSIYGRHVQRLIDRTERLQLDPDDQTRLLQRKGGTSAALALAYGLAILASLGGGAWAVWSLLLPGADGAT